MTRDLELCNLCVRNYQGMLRFTEKQVCLYDLYYKLYNHGNTKFVLSWGSLVRILADSSSVNVC